MWKKYLNRDEKFIKGPWKDEWVADVASEVPDYLEFLLSEKELCFDEEKAIRDALEENNP
jgi:hypothetical protein